MPLNNRGLCLTMPNLCRPVAAEAGGLPAPRWRFPGRSKLAGRGGSPRIFYLVAVPDLPIPFRGDYWVWVIEYDGISKKIF